MAVDPSQFEREKWRDEVRLREREIEIRERETTRTGWRNPLVVAVAAAALAAFGNAIVTMMNGQQMRALEERRAELETGIEDRRAEAQRILEVIRSDDPEAVRNNLSFLLEAGLIGDLGLSARLTAYLDTTPDSRIPRLPQRIGTAPPQRNLHVLAVGIGNYGDPAIPDLITPPTDATAIAAVAEQQRGQFYTAVSARVLLDAAATGVNLQREIEALAEAVDPSRGDVALIHFGGHAAGFGDDGFCLVTHETKVPAAEAEFECPMPVAKLADLLRPVASRTHVILSIDACPGGERASPTDAFTKLGVTVLLSSLPGEMCMDESDSSPHSPYVAAMIEAFTDRADTNRDGAITVAEFARHVRVKTRELTDDRQVPFASVVFDGVFLAPVPDAATSSPIAAEQPPTSAEDLLLAR